MTKNQHKTERYLKSMLNESSSWEKELIAYAENHNVPIIEPISMNFIVSFIKLSQPINILEIGTAIGYSALSMHYGLPNAHINTLERNEDMFNEATKKFAKYHLNDKIDLIKGDALETLPNLIKENKTYDFIFIDAAKGQYKNFFEYATELQKENGIILTDNVLFKGYVAGKDRKSTRLNSLGKKINDYNMWLMKNKNYHTSIIPIGDGIALSVKN